MNLKLDVGFDKKTRYKVDTPVIKVSNLLDNFNKFKENRKARRET
jgi:hypothetical protein